MLGIPTPNFCDASSEFAGFTTTGHPNGRPKVTRGYGSSCWQTSFNRGRTPVLVANALDEIRERWLGSYA
jgi:hypothetical protein